MPISPSNAIVNVPNVLTAVRLALAIGVFVLIPRHEYLTALIVFVLAASTDWIDGYWARKYNQVTKLGRIFDPFVDKIIICGAFVYLAVEPRSGIAAWMAVLVMGREMLVTALRSFIETSGGDFSAQWSGKLKMVFQCAAVVSSLLVLRHHQLEVKLPEWLAGALFLSVWLAIISTVYSGLEYIIAASRALRS